MHPKEEYKSNRTTTTLSSRAMNRMRMGFRGGHRVSFGRTTAASAVAAAAAIREESVLTGNTDATGTEHHE